MIFNGYVPHRFIIESAMTRQCWRVEIEEERDGVIYFREGWEDFVETHALETGDFLLFEYEEQSIFLVKVYDRNGCQKMVLDAQGGKHNPVKIIEFEEREESGAFKYEPKLLGTNLPGQERAKRLYTDKSGIYKKKHAITRIPMKHVRTARVLFTENKMIFSVKIHKYMKYQFQQMTLPKAIAMKLAKKNELILEDAMGNRWPVGLSHVIDGRAAITRGWRAFTRDNKVAGGDLLRFEFLSDDLVNVFVKKASQVEHKSEEANLQKGATIAQNMTCETDELDSFCTDVSPAEASITTRRGGKRGSSESSSSSFSLLWRPATAGIYLHVPKAVIEGQNLVNKDNVVLRDPDGKCWPLEVSTRRDGRVALTNGWVDFWKGHAIKVGDSLDFEFVSEYLIQVKINRGKLDDLDSCTADVNLAEASITSKRARKRGCSAEPTSSSFSFLWGPATPGAYLHVPKVVTEGQNLANKDSVVLRDSDGKCWPVKVTMRRDGRVALTNGWDDFWKTQGIKAGDSLDFEFVCEDLIQVKINREMFMTQAAVPVVNRPETTDAALELVDFS
ncbi:B3 domain-containing protein REM6-like isoform X2 [Silene latifolia]|uniref:B3 domain-containing protein REM6-like isoform X2 n=1 Tax=Silene latifolia TaxID=37657 RepID=UPI003D7747CD